MRTRNPIRQNIFHADLSTPEGLALWIAPRILSLLAFFILATLQYADIAESDPSERVCPGLLQNLIFGIAKFYPASIYLFFVAIASLLTFVELNSIAIITATLSLTAFTLLPQFIAVCP